MTPQRIVADVRKTINEDGIIALDNGMYVIHTNQAGKSGDSWFPGLVLAIDPNGNLIGEHMPNEGMIIIEISRNTIEQARSSLSCTIDEIRPSIYK